MKERTKVSPTAVASGRFRDQRHLPILPLSISEMETTNANIYLAWPRGVPNHRFAALPGKMVEFQVQNQLLCCLDTWRRPRSPRLAGKSWLVRECQACKNAGELFRYTPQQESRVSPVVGGSDHADVALEWADRRGG